jgi:hypothetical protein
MCLWLAATALAALGGVATPASAAIRIVISDGSTTQVFYSSGDVAPFVATSLGAYDIVAGASLTNFGMQSSSGGSLQQSLVISDFVATGPLPMLTITASVINSVAGVSDGLVTGGNVATVLSASLARFTLPTGTGLTVGSDVDANANMVGGTVQNLTTVNGSLVASLAIPIDSASPPEAQQFANVGNDPALGYTLVSQVVISGAGGGLMASVSASSSVTTLIPEPGSLALWTLGAVGIAVTALRRRLTPVASG